MSTEPIDQPATIHEIVEIEREKLACAKDGAKTVLATTSRYLRSNPWVALAGAALVGGAIVALARPSRSVGLKRLETITKSSGISKLLNQLAKTLHTS